MTEESAHPGWMDESDDEVQLGLTCHVELEIEKGDTYREILAKAAKALRSLAVPLEAGKFEDGFHDVKGLDGEELGRIYLDYHGTM